MSAQQSLTTLFLALAVVDGPLKTSEREQVFFLLQRWRSSFTRSDFRERFRYAARCLRDAGDIGGLLVCAEAAIETIRERLERAGRAVWLFEQLCDLAQVDGPLAAEELIFLERLIDALGLGERVALDVEYGIATVRRLQRRAVA